jgi:DNA-binding HxlR family transcriptional regulator
MEHGAGAEDAASKPGGLATARLLPQDEHLFRDFFERFAVLAETCSRFSKAIYVRAEGGPEADREGAVRRSLSIARRVFGEGLVDILAVLYLKNSIQVEELQRFVADLSIGATSEKLLRLESSGLVQREPPFDKAAMARYSLTHKGTIIAQLGEPVFLYLRLTEGWTKSGMEEAAERGGGSARSRSGLL